MLAVGLSILMRRRSAASRHLMWGVALLASAIVRSFGRHHGFRPRGLCARAEHPMEPAVLRNRLSRCRLLLRPRSFPLPRPILPIPSRPSPGSQARGPLAPPSSASRPWPASSRPSDCWARASRLPPPPRSPRAGAGFVRDRRPRRPVDAEGCDRVAPRLGGLARRAVTPRATPRGRPPATPRRLLDARRTASLRHSLV
ncbi:hypothetical protein U1Q18_052115 [Sarracenia purpurea var. burkii]